MRPRPRETPVGEPIEVREEVGENELTRFARGTFDKYRKNVYSQNGEDGVLEEVLGRLGMLRRNQWAFECGALDGVQFSNTLNLVEKHGFCVLAVEGDATKFVELERTAREVRGMVAVRAWLELDRDTIGELLAQHGVPKDFALMSIDIDSFDYQAWRNLDPTYRPVVVVIEVDSSFPPGERQVHDPEKAGSMTSFTSMLELGRSKGYTLVAHTGNMIFVRDDQVPRLGMKMVDIRRPDKLFCWDWVPREKQLFPGEV